MLHSARNMATKLFVAVVAVMALVSCHKSHDSVPRPARSVYYWRTVMQLDSAERDFLTRNQVKKMYVRYFDVVV